MFLSQNKKNIILLLAGIYFMLAFSATTSACTVFKSSNSQAVLFGNVENEAPNLVYELHFKPADESQGYYGSFFLKGANGYVAGGMNDQGLCFDVAALPSHPAFNGKPYGDLMEYLLNECATVDDALGFFENYFWAGHTTNHIMIMDKTGKSVVVEIIENTLYVFYKTNGAQVMTNFSIADPEIRLGDYPCSRFETANAMLDTMDVTVSSFQKVCEKVSRAYYDALYGNVYDPDNLTIHFFNPNIKGSKITSFNLLGELEKGYHSYKLKNNEIILGTLEQNSSNFLVSQNAPNPFSHQISFMVNLPRDARLQIEICDLHGRLIQILEDDHKIPGTYTYTWNAVNTPAGIYFCRIHSEGILETRKWIKH